MLTFLIPFLHQTTTSSFVTLLLLYCFLFLFYIKPQLLRLSAHGCPDCFLFLFYIKPQPWLYLLLYIYNCFLFLFYIKPQLLRYRSKRRRIVSYSFSTSNHNMTARSSRKKLLFLIPFLHQTTTWLCWCRVPCWLFLIPFLHQTTTT